MIAFDPMDTPSPELVRLLGRKARRTIDLHAKRYRLETLEFCKRYGWVPKVLGCDMWFAYEEGCRYRFDGIGHPYGSFDNMTVDILHPAEPPYYYFNTRFCCKLCNSAKGQNGIGRWGAKNAWRAHPVRNHDVIVQIPFQALATGNWGGR